MLSESTVLPSKGLLYGDKLPDGKVEMRPMKVSEEKLLVRPDPAEVIDRIVEECLLTKSLPFEEFLVGDKNYMLFFLRRISYGEKYNVQIQCPKCNTPANCTLRIPQELRIRVLEEGVDQEPYKVELPGCKKTIEVKLLRVGDERAINKAAKNQRVKLTGESGDPKYALRLARHVVSIGGEKVNFLKAIEFVNDMLALDSTAIWNTVDEHDCGIDFMHDFSCNQCGGASEILIPMSSEFFRPKSDPVPR